MDAGTRATPPTRVSARAPGRPPDPGVEADLLRAARELLVEVGFDRLTIEAVATRCGAGKASVYRRWPSKTELVVAAATGLYPVPVVPDTGELREDLMQAGRAFIDQDGHSQAVLASMLVAGRHHPQLRALAYEAMGAPFNYLFIAVLTRAVDRGLVAPDLDIDTLSDVVPTFAFHRTVAVGQSISEGQLGSLVDGVLMPALTAGSPTSRPSTQPPAAGAQASDPAGTGTTTKPLRKDSP